MKYKLLSILFMFLGLFSGGTLHAQIIETFETGMPTSATTGTVALSSGQWTLGGAKRGTGHSGYGVQLGNGSSNATSISTPAVPKIMSITFWAKGSGASKINIKKSTDNGATFTVIQTAMAITSTWTSYTVQVNEVSAYAMIKFENVTSQTHYLDDFTITTGIIPTISVSTTDLGSLGLVAAGSNSASSNFTVSGTNLTADIALSTSTGFGLSLDNLTFASSLVIPQTGGAVSLLTVYVRYSPASAAGNVTGSISLTTDGALSKRINVSAVAIEVEPTVQSTISFGAVTGTSIEVTLSGGDGLNRVLVAREASPVSWIPTDGKSIVGADNAFTTAVDQGTGNKVIFNLPDSVSGSVTVTGLSVATTYYFAVYDYNGAAGTENYLIVSPGTGNQKTLIVPGLFANPGIVNFGNLLVNTTSAEKTLLLSGRFLSPDAGNISISVPDHFEISKTTGSGFNNVLSLDYSGGTLPASTLYVRFKPDAIAQFAGIISAVGGSVSLNIPVSGYGKDSAGLASKDIYVSPDGNDITGNGSFDNPYKSLYQAGLKLTDDFTLILRGGTYLQDSIILRNQSLRNIAIINYPGEHPIIDGTTGYDVVVLYCSYSHVSGLEIIKAGHNALAIMGHYNVVENCSFHHGGDAGMKLGSHYQTLYPRGNTIRNCDAYANYDAGKNGGNADGYAAKWNVGSGNKFVSCRAWENSDDGFDLWQADSTIIMDSCWCFRNGYDVFKVGSNGNGNGFKIGGAPVCVPHIMRNCISFDNKGESGGKGFDQNSNFAGHIMLNCLSWGNSYLDFNFYKPSTNGTLIAKNDIQFKGKTSPYIKFVDGDISNNSWAALKFQTGNTWTGFTVTDDDFQSVDTTLAKLPRRTDGILQFTNLYRLKPGSQLLDKGVDVGIAYFGSAPDLGPYETGLEPPPVGIKSEPIVGPRSFNLYQNYPNPFNPSTMIQFSIAQPSKVQLKVYNALGREVMTLVDGQLNTGVHTVNFNASNLPTGVYFYRLITNQYVSTKKMILIK